MISQQQRMRPVIGPPPPKPPVAGQQVQPTQPVGQPATQTAVPAPTTQQQTQTVQPPPTGYAIGSALTQQQTPTQNMVAPPSTVPPPTSYPTETPTPPTVTQPYDTGTEAYPGANARYAEWAAANPTLAAGSDPTAYTAPGPESFVGPSKEQVHYIGNTGQTMTQAQYDQHIASGGWWTPPESELGPAQTSVPAGTIEITPEMIEENSAYWTGVYGQNQGGPASQAQIDAAPHTPPGTTFPNVGNPAVEAPWMGGPEPQYGPGTMGPNGEVMPDSYGYIRTDEDPYGLDDEYQQELLDLLSGQIQSGQGTTQWNPSNPFATGTTPNTLGETPFESPDVTGDGGQGGFGGTDPQDPDYVEQDEASTPVVPPPEGSALDVLDDVEDVPVERPDSEFDFETPDPMDIFNQGADALEARLERGREQSTRRIMEEMSARGTVSGSPEWGARSDLEGELNVQRQEGLSSLAREQQQFALQNRAQELQKELHDSSLAFEYASLEQDSRFRDAALRLQATGMDKDQAYRYAALNMDARFRQIAADLQSRGLDIEQSMRQAELQWSKERFGTEVGLQQEGLGLERDRFRAWIQSMLYEQGIESEDVPPWLQDLMQGRPGQSNQPPINLPPGSDPGDIGDLPWNWEDIFRNR